MKYTLSSDTDRRTVWLSISCYSAVIVRLLILFCVFALIDVATAVELASVTAYRPDFSDSGILRPQKHKVRVPQEPPESSYLLDLLRKSEATLGAVANLGLGAARVPEGLAIVTSNYFYLPLILTLSPPQWLPVNYRHPNWRTSCSGFANRSLCERMLDPELSRRDCPSTFDLTAETENLINEFRLRYEGVVNPDF